ncbi:flagellar hook protein FlgE [Candidatus Liberibacter solanacearum]|uniref:Flagellar hook protein FlgE n=1 Tax=Candidatus Liberibacter solanacearum TaxID=556287 RepID=A0A095A191_9HYPH|nr:flagellar hook protein FlgE [Candidatus Liberibacter solanacearum]KGB27816.1 flagellar hook protein FlgE [Candidatus Liberibacter solanacearum]KJZ81520.1 flagellar hook protein FlgE [Candidatus Liberibacter solanacearum]KJZ82420.1 Flagellar hook protein FlgE [Candidatus Liberibacter solanacearum]KQC49207.1 flagellar biosynthesis protein FlgE [Candidatus Liberibacter solanacearum]
MGILGTMKTAMSGMDAQSNRVSAVSDNIANVNTIGYKRTAVSFSSLVFPPAAGCHTSGGVAVSDKDMISSQGSLIHTASNTDLAIQGEGFFVVKDKTGTHYLTRSGDFQINNEGFLQNTAGYVLQGYPMRNAFSPLVLNSFQGLETINVRNFEPRAVPTTLGSIPANLDKDAKVVVRSKTPKSNGKDAEYTHKSSFSAYDTLGSRVIYDLYYTKVEDKKWEVSIFRQDQSSKTIFPYNVTNPLAVIDVSFDPVTGHLADSSPKEISFDDNTSGVSHPIKIDISKTTQLVGGFIPQNAVINGQAPGKPRDFSVSKDGNIDVIYDDGTRVPVYRLAIATVPSENSLKICDGNTYLPTRDSGDISIGYPGDDQRGDVFSGALETANVDIANELTELIEAQRNYAANSKVFQTGSDFMDILISLKR